jgi:hypothetical protein
MDNRRKLRAVEKRQGKPTDAFRDFVREKFNQNNLHV